MNVIKAICYRVITGPVKVCSIIYYFVIQLYRYHYYGLFSHFLHYFIFHFLVLTCLTLLTPSNGSLTCSNSNKTNSTCSYSCDVGYELIGSSQHTCQPSSFWSGEPSHCRPLQCSQLNPPDNGYIQLPCSHDYLSVCSVRCFHGYNITNGSDIVKCHLINATTVEWTPFGKCKSKLKPYTLVFCLVCKAMVDCCGPCDKCYVCMHV